MEDIVKIVEEYEKEIWKLQLAYQDKVRKLYPTSKDAVRKLETLQSKGEYDIIKNYELIAEELRKENLSDVLKDIVKQRLREEYKKITMLQEDIARNLGYKEPDSVTIDKLINDCEVSSALLDYSSPIPRILKCLKRIKYVHKCQDELLLYEKEELEQNFLRLTSLEIREYNAEVRRNAEENREEYEREREESERVVPVFDARGDLPLMQE